MTNLENHLSAPDLSQRIYGCWLGKSIGGTLGLPAEGRTERLSFSYYDPVPTSAPPNDDLELQLVWLHLVETKGLVLTQEDFAQAWIRHIHYMWDEYGVCRWNLRRGLPTAEVGTCDNWFVSGMGSPIRSEIWACLANQRTDLAAAYARLDASLDHGVEGIDGEVFLAVMQNRVLNGDSLAVGMATGLAWISPATETSVAIRRAIQLHGEEMETWAAWEILTTEHTSDNFTYAPLNLGLTVWALLYGAGDFEASILLAVNGGYDTDCTAATVGATLGLALGAEAIPETWKKPIGEAIYLGPGILGIDCPPTLRELTDRTVKLASGTLPEAAQIITPGPLSAPLPEARPGDIELRPLDQSSPILWANGMLPESVCTAGGAEWTWEVNAEVQGGCGIVCVARQGMRLFLDGQWVHTTPPTKIFVPAPHRVDPSGRFEFMPLKASYQIRVELEQKGDLEAAVILTMKNRHLSSWTAEVLPHAALFD